AFEVFLAARHQVSLFPEVQPTLEVLANRYQLAVLTNGNADVRRLGLADISGLPCAPRNSAWASPTHCRFARHCAAPGWPPIRRYMLAIIRGMTSRAPVKPACGPSGTTPAAFPGRANRSPTPRSAASTSCRRRW